MSLVLSNFDELLARRTMQSVQSSVFVHLIVGKYFGDVFFALNFDLPRHMRSPLVNWGLRSLAPRRSLILWKFGQPAIAVC